MALAFRDIDVSTEIEKGSQITNISLKNSSSCLVWLRLKDLIEIDGRKETGREEPPKPRRNREEKERHREMENEENRKNDRR